MSTHEQISEEKKKELEKELLELKTVTRKQILDRLVAARALGDLKENTEYHTARDEQGKNESQIREIEYILKTATIAAKSDNGRIGLGSTITVKKKDSSDEKIFKLVSKHEADISNGFLSIDSPIGSALSGHCEGDSVEVDLPNGVAIYLIVSVN